VLIARTERRGLDASDADAGVVRLQLAEDAGVIRWPRLDASPSAASVLEQAQALMDATGRDVRSTSPTG